MIVHLKYIELFNSKAVSVGTQLSYRPLFFGRIGKLVQNFSETQMSFVHYVQVLL